MTVADNRILAKREGKRLTLTLNRQQSRNSLDDVTLERYLQLFDEAERDPELRLIVLEGSEKIFCTGMDLEAFAAGGAKFVGDGKASLYMNVLERISGIGRVVAAKITGEVTAGGVGVAAACDLVFASPSATFALSEALWGLLPAMVMPFLIRRVGYQSAYRMTLTTQTVDAAEAHRIHLVDTLAPDPEAAIQSLATRLLRLHPQTVADMKAYFRKMWIVDDAMKESAVKELGRLAVDPRVRQNIKNYLEFGRLPWDTW